MNSKKQQFLQLAIIEQKHYEVISQKIGVDRKVLSTWWVELKKERTHLAHLRRIWKSKFKKKEDWIVSFWDFKIWFEETPKKCHYCKITESDIEELLKLSGGQLTKRKRGRKLEIDRKQPNESYAIITNLVFSCYWCNNAKTDTFSADEFKLIGEAIGETWKRRLANLNKDITS